MCCARLVPTLLLLGLIVAPVWADEAPVLISPGSEAADRMRGVRGASRAAMPATGRERLQRAFRAQYAPARTSKRQLFEKYLDTLGPDGILDVLEATHPLCHAQAHELGRAIVARVRDLGAALGACKDRCTSGCMHGALMEAFGGPTAIGTDAAAVHHAHHAGHHRPGTGHHPGAANPPAVTVADVEAKIVSLCSESGQMAKLYERGNCAHAMGHALMAVTGRDVERSVTGCVAFGEPGMAYYCATGVFMEYFEAPERAVIVADDLHAPCDTYTRFPAACYRYTARRMLAAFDGNVGRVAAECV